MKNSVSFGLKRWSYWEPSPGQAMPDLPEVPPLLRRRASDADRMALRVAFDCVGAKGSTAAVFCSRHGEVLRSIELLEQISKGEPMSPMTFSLSVHNSAATLYSITRGDKSPMSAIAAGADSLPQGLLEAAGLLSEGLSEVLVVAYDAALPEPFQRYKDEEEAPCAMALLLAKSEGPGYSLEWGSGELAGNHSQLPQVARFLKNQEAVLEIESAPRRWTWRRNA